MPIRLLAAALALALLAGCQTVSKKDRELANVQYDLAVKARATGDARTALGEIEKAVKLDPTNAEVRNLQGLLLFLPPFRQTEQAIAAFRKAVELKPGYSDAKVNLGAAYMSLERWEDALQPLDEARQDLLYRDAHLAEGNYGWCRYKLGDRPTAIRHLTNAVSMNPGFCVGYRNLAEIHEAGGELDTAVRYLERYAKACPAIPEADFRRGQVLLKQGEVCAARDAFLSCSEKAKGGDAGAECAKQASLVPTDRCPAPPEPDAPAAAPAPEEAAEG